ncbi:peptide deformylase [Sporosarcina sp. Marseille-Q4063]|uniref:peptide deformylase n=1 Tax=Sporosarcina sp. Marseille-Q4063 TaxID=2810514 RepID=UPI001BAE9C6A|nr:peptide deformylase [Sporosarcina sp. Marseille-Q4063]QUW21743.1 peptide deformylase [Sporosarcina sp. Marseille-Q4063]
MIVMKDIVREGHPALRKTAEEMTFPLTNEEIDLCDDLLTYLKNSHDPVIAEKYNLRAGVGLAAPQVNVSKRVFALHIIEMKGEPISFVAINPKIISHSVERTYLTSGEGCLSVDRNVEGFVPRYSRITIKAFDQDGNEFKKRLRGLAAIAFQHELDHLNGIMFYDHIDKNEPYKEIPGATPFERA